MSSDIIDLSADSPPTAQFDNDVYANETWQPFYLNRLGEEGSLSPSARSNNATCCLTIQDIISNDQPILSIAVLTYEIDQLWFLESLPYIIDLPLLVLHGGKDQKDIQLDNMKFSTVDMGLERYGTHHNKVIVVFYESGVRICITTANFTETDFLYKLQGIFTQDFPVKNLSSSKSSLFENDLIAHCECITPVNKKAKKEWSQTLVNLRNYDFSTAEVILISSVPGR